MEILYCRVSTIEQNTDRQKARDYKPDRIVEDKCSGSIPFFEREGGKDIKAVLDAGKLTKLVVLSIDRLGRDFRDIINTIHYFTSKRVPIHFMGQALTTVDSDGNENAITKLIISILGIVGEMERTQGKERQREGIRVAKLKGSYTGRAKGSTEDVLAFLSKPNNKKALEYLNTGHNIQETAKLTGIHYNTVSKVKRLGSTPTNTPV